MFFIHQFTFLSSGMMKGNDLYFTQFMKEEDFRTFLLAYESGFSYRLIKLSEDALLSIIGEDGKDCMEGSAEKKDDRGSPMDMKRNPNPSKPSADLKQNQKHIQNTKN